MSRELQAALVQQLGVAVKLDWLQQCCQHLRDTSHPGLQQLPPSRQLQLVLGQLLFADLHSCGEGGLFPQTQGVHKQYLAGRFLLQVDECFNMTCGFKDRHVDQKGAGRCLKLKLTDGITFIHAMEHTHVPSLSACMPAGCKVLVTNPWVRRGVLLLTPDSVQLLGGKVQRLQEAQERLITHLNKPAGHCRVPRTLQAMFAEAAAAAWPAPAVGAGGAVPGAPAVAQGQQQQPVQQQQQQVQQPLRQQQQQQQQQPLQQHQMQVQQQQQQVQVQQQPMRQQQVQQQQVQLHGHHPQQQPPPQQVQQQFMPVVHNPTTATTFAPDAGDAGRAGAPSGRLNVPALPPGGPLPSTAMDTTAAAASAAGAARVEGGMVPPLAAPVAPVTRPAGLSAGLAAAAVQRPPLQPLDNQQGAAAAAQRSSAKQPPFKHVAVPAVHADGRGSAAHDVQQGPRPVGSSGWAPGVAVYDEGEQEQQQEQQEQQQGAVLPLSLPAKRRRLLRPTPDLQSGYMAAHATTSAAGVGHNSWHQPGQQQQQQPEQEQEQGWQQTQQMVRACSCGSPPATAASLLGPASGVDGGDATVTGPALGGAVGGRAAIEPAAAAAADAAFRHPQQHAHQQQQQQHPRLQQQPPPGPAPAAAGAAAAGGTPGSGGGGSGGGASGGKRRILSLSVLRQQAAQQASQQAQQSQQQQQKQRELVKTLQPANSLRGRTSRLARVRQCRQQVGPGGNPAGAATRTLAPQQQQQRQPQMQVSDPFEALLQEHGLSNPPAPPQQQQPQVQQQQQAPAPQLLLGALHWQPPSWKGAAAAGGPPHVDTMPGSTKGAARKLGPAAGPGLLGTTTGSRGVGQEGVSGVGRQAVVVQRAAAAAVDLTADSSEGE